MDWRAKGLCRRFDPELWFPVGNSGPAQQQAQEAKSICQRCPVRLECLSWAMETGQREGVWGGMTEQERRGARRQSA
jgi:WhiB family redox-sensing transcriptional regulator